MSDASYMTVCFELTLGQHRALIAECISHGKTEDEFVHDLVVNNIRTEEVP